MLEIHLPIYLRIQGTSLGLEWMSNGIFEDQVFLLTVKMVMEWCVLLSYSLKGVVSARDSGTTSQSRRGILMKNTE